MTGLAAQWTPAAAGAVVTLFVGLLVAAGTQIVTHALRVRQWRYERRFDVFSEFLSALTELGHRTSGLLPDSEASATETWPVLGRELNAAQERITTALGQVRLAGGASTVRNADELFVAAMRMYNMATVPVDQSRRFNPSEAAEYMTCLNDTYRPAQSRFIASARSDISER